MTDHVRVSIIENGSAAQIYFKAHFVRDSACPLEAGEEAIAYTTEAGGVHVVPLRNLDAVASTPITVDPPPTEAIPARLRPQPGETNGEATHDGGDVDLGTDMDLDAHQHGSEP